METFYTFPPERIQETVQSVLAATGSPAQEAQQLASHLVESNLTGHDSHGVIRLSQYMEMLREGQIQPGRRMHIVRDEGATVLVHGDWGYGQTIAYEATELAISRAREHRVANVGMSQLNHIGRLAAYAQRIAEEGLIGMVFTAAGGFSSLVAPYGSNERRLSTNPIAAAFPSNRAHPIVFDFATSAYAEGKFRVMRDGGISAPEGILIDSEGQPSTNAEDLYTGGAILPVGGKQGYKGYLLAFLVEVLAGLLTGGGHSNHQQAERFNNCSLLWAIDVSAFRGLAEFQQELEDLIAYLKASRSAPGEEVLYPGEKEARISEKRRREGLPLAQTTVEAIQGEMDRAGLPGVLLEQGTRLELAEWKF